MRARRFTLALLIAAQSAVFSVDRASADDADNYTSEEVEACSGDAFQFCGADLLDPHRVEACMIAHKSQLSRACQAMFDQPQRRN